LVLKHLPNALYICKMMSEKGKSWYAEKLTTFGR
jgi:hypothetical protein